MTENRVLSNSACDACRRGDHEHCAWVEWGPIHDGLDGPMTDLCSGCEFCDEQERKQEAAMAEARASMPLPTPNKGRVEIVRDADGRRRVVVFDE